MRVGDTVYYVREPALYGCLTIEAVLTNGRLVCRTATGHDEEFDPQEVDDGRHLTVDDFLR